MLIDSGFVTSSLRISGSFTQTGNSVITGSLIATQGITGSLFGTASWANNVISASFATNAASATSASFATNAANATTASFATSTISASYTLSASYATGSGFASSASFTLSSSIASRAVTASYAITASYLSGSVDSASYAVTAATASRALNANTASFASFAITASIADNAITASRALNANTASFATSAANATTASFATSAASATSASFATLAASATSSSIATSAVTASSADNFNVRNTLTVTTIVAQTITSSTDFVTGSTRFGSLITNTHQFTGSVSVSGSITVTPGVTNDLTASRAIQANTASFATSAATSTSASFATSAASATSASFATSAASATSASFATNAANATSASIAANAVTASRALNANTASYVQLAASASYALTASHALNAGGGITGLSNFIATGSVSASVDVTPTQIFRVISGSSTFIQVNNSGNVGIGTTSPGTRFEIKSSAANNLGGLLLRATSTANFPAILYENSGNGGTLDLYNSATLTTRINSNGDSYFNVGNVGIGPTLTSPTARLHISSSANNALRIESQDPGDPIPTVYIEGNKGGAANYTATLIELRSNIEFRGKGIHMTTSASNAMWFAGIPYQGSAYQIGYDASANRLPYTYESASLFIDTSRNIGIGTTAPNQRLDVVGRLKFRSNGVSSAGHWLTGNNGSEDVFVGLQGNSSTDAFGIYSGGSWRFTILNGGNVGIGTTSPAGQLEVTRPSSGFHLILNSSHPNSASYTQYRVNGSGGWEHGMAGLADSYKYYFSYGAIGAANAKVTFQNDGNVGIGTTSPGAALDVNGRIRLGSNAQTEIYSSGNRVLFRAENSDNVAQFATYGMFLPVTGQTFNLYLAGSMQLGYTDTSPVISMARGSSGAITYIQLAANGSSYFNGGSVGIGTTSPGAILDVVGNQTRISGNSSTTGELSVFSGQLGSTAVQRLLVSQSYADVYQLRVRGISAGVFNSTTYALIDTAGTGYFAGDVVAFYSFSDANLKTNISPITNALDKVVKLKGVNYEWKDGYRVGRQEIGLIAQQVEEVVPEVVRTQTRLEGEQQNNYKTVDYDHLTALLIEAVKEQQKQIDELKYLLQNK